MTQRNADDPRTPGRIMIRATDILPEIGNKWQWWARFRQNVANLITGANRLPECPDDASKAMLPINIDVFAELQRTRVEMESRGYGRYPEEPVRYRAIVDGAGDEVKDRRPKR
jgi:hypothetical protein